MKNFTLFILVTLLSIHSFSQQIIAKGSGGWEKSSSWNKSRVPQNNDTVVIPATRTITISNNEQVDNVVVIVEGTLNFNKGKLILDEKSKVIVEQGGKLVADGADEQLRIANVIKYSGKEGDLQGPIFADNTTGGGFVPFSILPVRFLSFDVRKTTGGVVLTWATEQEVNNSHFNIERSVDGKTWATIGMVFAKEGTNVNRYEYKDESKLTTVAYYRLRQVDIDGRSSFSKVQSIRSLKAAPQFLVYSPSQQNIRVSFSNPTHSQVEVILLNSNGQVVSTKIAATAVTKVDLTGNNLSKGLYIVQVLSQDGLKESRKILL